ncbi:Rossmann-like and DUF2520 domain-containing protein [Pseudofrankia sp. DC12]|uniref:Rossmann-like and DUF2520 domain-containing protein n=1 Tax=Pseudofrankia sp. DC12 TaxID=683315 RepID=UPI000A6D67EF|nr:Rossmann-like and DUF2520 domain-containing protein [Pseudofrankia sp. DC12]
MQLDVGLDVGVVGFGRAGAAVAVALADAGHRLAGVSVRSTAAAERASRWLPAAELLSAAELAARVDVLVLAVSDDALGPAAAAVAQPGGPGGPRPGTVVVHLSGRHGLGPLTPVVARGASRAAVHPIMSLAGLDPAADAGRLRGTTFGVTADPAAWPVARQLVDSVGGRTVEIAEEARTTYHAAIVLGANYLAALAGAAADLLTAVGLDDARAALAPLLRVSLDNALRDGDAATTGPVRRGDAGTVDAHLAALLAADPTVVPAYVTLARLAATRLEAADLLAAPAAAALRAVLDSAQGA